MLILKLLFMQFSSASQHKKCHLICVQQQVFEQKMPLIKVHQHLENRKHMHSASYEGWNFNSGNYLFTTDTK